MNKKPVYAATIQCLGICLVIAAVLFAAGWALYGLNTARIRVAILQEQTGHVNSIARLMGYELADMTSDVRFLVKMRASREVFSGAMSDDMGTNLLYFTLDKKAYDQLRYINTDCREVFRINYNGGLPYIVLRKDLQDQSDCGFVRRARELKVGAIHLSRLGLTREHGKVERPLKPVLRVACPIFDDYANRQGMLVLNLFGRRLLRIGDDVMGDAGGQLMILDDDGFFLKGSRSGDEWGFMFPERDGDTFAARHPKAWQAVRSGEPGSVFTPQGLFVHRSLSPGPMIADNLGRNVVSDAGTWHIVAHVPGAVMERRAESFLHRLYMLMIPLGLALMFGASFACHQRRRRKQAQETIIEEHAAYSRFVPKEFLELLGKGDYRELALDSHVTCRMAILFSDIRSYTKLSEGLDPKQVIDLLNEYFVVVNTPVKGNNGFVDSFHGDALLALFPGGADTAVRAAVGMHARLEEFNFRREAAGLPPVAAGIGLHFGEVTLGALGTDERMQATVIGDVVNLAARIESSTTVFGVNIVISGDVYDSLSDPDAFLIREIDMVRVKGKQQPVRLFEVFDADREDVAARKLKAAPFFARGLAAYRAGDFGQAVERFAESLATCPDDAISEIFLKRSKTMLRIPPGDGWTGISTL